MNDRFFDNLDRYYSDHQPIDPGDTAEFQSWNTFMANLGDIPGRKREGLVTPDTILEYVTCLVKAHRGKLADIVQETSHLPLPLQLPLLEQHSLDDAYLAAVSRGTIEDMESVFVATESNEGVQPALRKLKELQPLFIEHNLPAWVTPYIASVVDPKLGIEIAHQTHPVTSPKQALSAMWHAVIGRLFENGDIDTIENLMETLNGDSNCTPGYDDWRDRFYVQYLEYYMHHEPEKVNEHLSKTNVINYFPYAWVVPQLMAGVHHQLKDLVFDVFPVAAVKAMNEGGLESSGPAQFTHWVPAFVTKYYIDAGKRVEAATFLNRMQHSDTELAQYHLYNDPAAVRDFYSSVYLDADLFTRYFRKFPIGDVEAGLFEQKPSIWSALNQYDFKWVQ